MQFSDMLGMTMTEVEGKNGDDVMSFVEKSGRKFQLYHSQDCCERVSIDQVDGDLKDLVGNPLLQCEEVSSDGAPKPPGDYVDSYTWTFYKLATVKGYVTVKWLGESNGYYSESVYFREI